MKQISASILLIIVLAISACTPQATATSTPPPSPRDAMQVPETESPVATEQPATSKSYTNEAFGLGFQFPSGWFGPDEYTADRMLRLEVGSDKVYPYGTGLDERIYELKNSYDVVIQYSKNDQNQYWKDMYQALLNLKDGESLSDARSLTIRVRQLSLGRFAGIEYISTLSETAQTELLYTRQVILFDQDSNLLTVMGSPNNVEIADGTNWRDAYRMVDQANLDAFHQIVESITVQ